MLTVDTCSGTNYDSKLTVYCKDCTDLVCVGGNDDSCGLQSSVSWCGSPGTTYLVLVHGYGTSVGDFSLTATEGATCTNYPPGCAVTGACCLTTGGCVEVESRFCNGDYQGDGTNCGGFRAYEEVPGGGSAFEDISSSGTFAPNAGEADDGGDTAAMGFRFVFWGDDHTDIGMSSNGYLTFGSDLTDYSNDPIPSTIDPNDFIAPLWDDLDTRGAAATVHYETLGTPGSRRFITQWTDVTELAGTTTYTFQAVLFERSNCIELRYADYTPETYTGDFTIGVENQDGTLGLAINPAPIRSGDSIRLCPIVDPNPCNEAPVANSGGPYIAECEGSETPVQLDGSGSYDPDGDPLDFAWTTDCDGTFDDPSAIAPVLTVQGAHCDMTCNLTLTVSDPYGASDWMDTTVTVEDTTPPDVEESAEVLHSLWSPNHKYVCLDTSQITPVITEVCSGTASWWFSSCTSSQPDNANGDGNTTEDCLVSPDQAEVCLRAERQGGDKEGRRYELAIVAEDDCGNVSGETVIGFVAVALNQSDK
jgi:hypothetical protein